MPTYPYECPACQETWEVSKRLSDIDLPESCPNCQTAGNRYISRTHFYGASDWDKAEFNPGLGCVVKNKQHRAEICKRRGLVEIGNDFNSTEKWCAANDKAREERRERAWAEV